MGESACTRTRGCSFWFVDVGHMLAQKSHVYICFFFVLFFLTLLCSFDFISTFRGRSSSKKFRPGISFCPEGTNNTSRGWTDDIFNTMREKPSCITFAESTRRPEYLRIYRLKRFTKFIKFFQTHQLSKSSNFLMESGDFFHMCQRSRQCCLLFTAFVKFDMLTLDNMSSFTI